MSAAEARAHHLWCFNCDENSPGADSVDDCEDLAGREGWVLGIDIDGGGGAQFACADCAELLDEALPVKSLRTTRQEIFGGGA
ncbi:hypothetical protein ERT44_05290 [Stenotrophomonas sp. MA5]|uniref:hypothetical protein n=1 Tax=Stenotrophomonas sp. MA5 TaxID=2508572 RepID=UPI001009D3CB|nr:hypothetical protein [Stenotrophomonas sp. MA5]RXK68635.1 hypothetical protein ERT44_05290 [Stenotrophomonas sp. MA5]